MPIHDQPSSFSFYLQPAAPGSPGSSIFDLPVDRAPSGATPPVLPPPEPSKDLGNLESARPPASDSAPSYVLVSGGTGGNAICSGFVDACFVLPVSDDGGSSSEIIRVLGGPSVGDIRSRLVRLIPHASEASPLAAIRTLLAYRLPAKCSEREAREEWRDIVEGRSALWTGIPSDRKETIRGFLVHFESQLLTRAHKNFDFRNGSIGNYFIAGAQNFFRSLPSATFLFSSITNSQAHILPVIITNHIVTLAAELEDGQRLMGQCEISHPVLKPRDPSQGDLVFASFEEPDDTEELEVSQNVMYRGADQDTVEALSARISRIYYMNSYGMEIHPSPNPEFLSNLKSKNVLVYSCGSLWTSIMPCLALRGVATAIASSYSLRAKVLLLNCENDRETEDYTAIDYINAIVRTLNSEYSKPRYGLGNAHTIYPPSAFITDLVYLSDTKIPVDEGAIAKLGIKCTVVEAENKVGEKVSRFEGEALRGVLDGIYEDRRQE